jgi:hypothetical protein
MPDLLLHLAPAPIRGTAALVQPDEPHDPEALFSIYDFLDLAGCRPPRDQPRERGPFSRDLWARLTRAPFGRPKTALALLASHAPIRASATFNRKTDMPVLPVAGLLVLLHCVVDDAKRSKNKNMTDRYLEFTADIRNKLENFQKGDCSMLETLTEPAPDADEPAHKQRKNAAATTDATDTSLRFSPERVIFGALHPVHQHLFSVYQFINLIGRLLHSGSHSPQYARRFWKYTKSINSELASASLMVPIRCSEICPRKTTTPALNVDRLKQLLRIMLHHREENNGMYKGKRANKIYVPVDQRIVAFIGEILDAYISGDRSMIDDIQMKYFRY